MMKEHITAAVVAAATLAAWPVGAQTTRAAEPGGRSPEALIAELDTMEEVLARTVALAARHVEQQVPASMPGLLLFAGPTQVRGFYLADYGVFFDVEYPVLRRTVLWSMQRLGSDLEAELLILQQRLEEFAGMGVRERARRDPNSFRRPVGLTTAPDVSPREVTPAPPVSDSSIAPPSVDLDEQYRELLGQALTDALLQQGGALAALLDAEAWLTVTARDGRARRQRDTTFRVKAGDVSALRAGTLTMEAVQERVDRPPF